ncbi:MAG: RNA polymerase sigma factor [Cyclobacteriaceae bacterium]
MRSHHGNSSVYKRKEEVGIANSTSYSNAQLWDEFKAGSKEAFDEIYERFFQPLCSYGDRICPDKSLVEDVVQDVFIHLWTKKEHLGSTSTIKFYLFLCLKRRLLRVISQEKKRPYIISDKYRFNLILKASPDVSPEAEEMQMRLAEALKQLTDRQQEAIYLKFYNSLSFQEVASIMDIEVRSVYNLISRTIDILRTELRHNELSTPSLLSFTLLLLPELIQ